MAEDNGPMLLGGNVSAGVADAIMSQAQALQVEYESMTGYKKLVDALLKKLEGSEAADKNLADGTLPAGTLGTGFPEADSLFKAYSTVHTELQKLSQGLAAQIEALGIAVLTTGNGYAGVDEDTQARMRAIIRQSKQDYVRDRDPLVREEEEARRKAAAQQGTPTPTHSKSGGSI
ncbi:hypothetical protein ACFXPI_19230 [Streptomyces sp. NPDC059104]|uniref:hypothetical protein n=1 Tax=Streptomyces sp. NPDC059104 TaxID=3346729 RepID=UPI0036CAC328